MKQLTTALALLLALATQAQTTWYEIPVGTDEKLNCIHFVNSQVGYIGGNDSLLLKTTDGGQSWNPINYSLQYNGDISNLKFVTENIGFMTISPYQGAYKTTDGGQTWTMIDSLSDNLCYRQGMYFWNENNGFIGGSGCFQGELIDKMQNGSWSAANIVFETFDASNRIMDIDFEGNSFGLAASTSGYIFRTTDGGVNWDTVRASTYPLTSIEIINADTAYAGYNASASGNFGFGILMTSDGGLTWQEDMSSATFYYPDFLDVHETAVGRIFLGAQHNGFVGTRGLIFESSDAGFWNYTDVAQPINNLSSYPDNMIFGADVVFAVGDSGLVLTTKDFTTGINTIKNTENADVRLFPNPANDAVRIEMGNNEMAKSLQVFSSTGQLLQTLQPQNNQFSVQGWAAGLYMLRIDGKVGQWLMVNN